MSENNLDTCNLCAYKRFSVYKGTDVCLKLKSVRFDRVRGEQVVHVPCVHAVDKCDEKGYFIEKESLIDIWMDYFISKKHQVQLIIAFGAGLLVPKPILIIFGGIAAVGFIGKLVANFIIRKYVDTK